MPMNPQWRLVARPQGLFKESDFRWVEEETPPLEDGQALVRTIYLSLDPTNRGWAAGDTYLPAVPLDTVMRGIALGRVEESRAPRLAPGDVVQGLLGWLRVAVVPASALIEARVCLGRSGRRSGFPSSTLRLKSARFRAPLACSNS